MNSPEEAGLPPSPAKPVASWYAQGLSDGLGDRLLMFDNSDAPSLELLRFRPDLAEIPGFETALRDQVLRLGRFRHPAFARARSVQRLEPDDDLALISNCTPGKRLSELLHQTRGPAFAAALIKQLAPALVLFQQHAAGSAHGVLSPDRIVVSPEGRLTIVEHVVGPAIDTLNLRPAQLKSIGIALPPAAAGAAPRLDVATDWYQLGLVAVSVLLGRELTASDLPQLETLLDGLDQSTGRDGTVLSPWTRQWLERALQISSTRIESGEDARAALDELLGKERSGDSRRVGSLHREHVPPLALAAVPSTGQSSDDGEARSRPGVSSTVGPVPILPPIDEPPALEARTPTEARPRPPQAPAMFHQGGLSLFEQEMLARKKGPLDFKSGAALHGRPAATRPPLHSPPAVTRPSFSNPPAAPRPPLHNPSAATPPRPDGVAERRGVASSVVAALVLLVAVEAGVIVWLAHALWFSPRAAISVETAGSGESVVVSSNSTEATPLRFTAAPDMHWVSVTSQPAAGLVGGKVKETQAGIIRITSPIQLQVFEASRQLGSVPGADLRVPPGRHDIALVNAALGYRLEQSLEVGAGQTVSIHIAPPHGFVTAYAVPTAEVSIDGQAVGRTPLGPLPLALGEHVVTFRHPAGHTDRKRVTVKSGETVRVIGNLRR
ncbi:MAG TPA: PEGA domain-containing protein [Vicinamibacterales bacterium]|nr:PEGA domain-containing protein [Vicinamibacterales bacterium]